MNIRVTIKRDDTVSELAKKYEMYSSLYAVNKKSMEKEDAEICELQLSLLKAYICNQVNSANFGVPV